MKNRIRQTISQMGLGLGLVLFSLFLCGTVSMACVISLAFVGPNLAGIGNILIPTVVADPIAYILFFSLFLSINRFKWHVRFLVPALIFPIIFGIALGITMFERTPKNIFRVFVSEPIPVGVSNIRAQDITMGIDYDIIVAFNTTPEALDEIIAKNEFELDEESVLFDNKSPHRFFPDVNWSNQWTRYGKCGDPPEQYCMWMWVNPEQTTVLYRYWSF